MAGSRLLSPIIAADQKELRDLVLEAGGYKDDAETAAGLAAADADSAEIDRGLAQTAKEQTELLKNAVDLALADAQAVVVSGDAALNPTAGSVPLGRSDGYLNPNWVPKSLTPVQAVENVSGATGLIAPNDTEHVFSQRMSREYELFIPATLTKEIQIFRDGNFGAYITTDKKFRVNYGGSYQTIERINVSNDWVDVQFAYSDNGTSAVTFDVNVNGLTFGTQQVATYSDAYIRSIFESEYGFLHVASMGYGTLTNAGVNKMNNYGDACGSLPAVAGNAVTFAQATGTARPLIGRVPVGGRRQRLLNTERPELWTKTSAISVSDKKTGGPVGRYWTAKRDGGGGNALFVITGASAGVQTRQIILRGNVGIYFGVRPGEVFSNARLCIFDPATGEFTQSAGFGTTINTTTEDLGDGWWRLSFTHSSGETSGFASFVWGFAVNPTEAEVDFAEPQFEFGETKTNYQVGGSTARDVTESGIADQDYLFFDRSDDVLSATISAITGGEIIIAGRNGIWHDSLTASAGTFNIGPTTYTGGPNGILAVLGDILGWAIKETPFTTPQRDALYAFFRSRGAAAGPLIETGSELITNGTFDTDIAGWTKTAGTSGDTLVWDSGKALATRTSIAFSYRADVSLVAGSIYLLSVEHEYVSGATSSGLCAVYSSSAFQGGSLLGSASSGQTTTNFTRTGIVTALSTATAYVQIGITGANGERKFDNVSLKEYTFTPWS